MNDKRANRGLDVSNWILSPEIREYLRANHRFSVKEKVGILHGGCRSVEEKRATLAILFGEAEDEEDRETIQCLLQLYNWSLDEMRNQQPKQVYLFLEHRSNDPISELRYQFDCAGSVAGVFDTYDQLMAHLRELEVEWECADDSEYVGWRVIDWTHPAQPSELLAGQEVLAELSDYLRQLWETDREASEDMYLWISEDVPLRLPEDVTLEELLELAREEERKNRKENIV